MKLSKELIRAINKELRKDVRKEAKLVLSLTSDKNREEFLEYSKKDCGNICCLVVDYAKKELVESGILKQNETDAFGKFI